VWARNDDALGYFQAFSPAMVHLVRKLQPDYYRARFFTEWQFYGLSPWLRCMLYRALH